MSYQHNQLVDLPAKGIVLRKHQNGTIYVYYTLRAFRNSKGAPTSETALIGKRDPATGKLIPNKRYATLFPQLPTGTGPIPMLDCTIGPVHFLETIAKQTGITACLKSSFPSLWHEILTIAFHIAGDNSIRVIDPASCTNTKTVEHALASPSPSTPFSSGSRRSITLPLNAARPVIEALTPERQMDFFKRWAAVRPEADYQCFNVSILVPGGRLTQGARWDNHHYTQRREAMSLWMFIGKDTGLPRYYNRLPVLSSTQGLHLDAAVRDTCELGIQSVGYNFERRFVTCDNLAQVTAKCKRMLFPWPVGLEGLDELIATYGAQMRDPNQWLSEEQRYSCQFPHTIGETSYTVHLFYSSLLYARTERALYAQHPLPEPEALRQALAKAGYEAYLSTVPNLTTSYVQKVLQRREQVEEIIDILFKIPEFWALNQSPAATKAGRSFICFIATTLRIALIQSLQQHPRTSHLSWTRLTNELNRIEENIRKNQLTPTQKLLVEVIRSTKQRR